MEWNSEETQGSVVNSIIVEDTSDSGIVTLPTAYLMDLPDELAEWVMHNQELVMRVQDALKRSYAATPTEEQVWEVIAATCDPNPPQWQNAREGLRSSQKAWEDMHHPTNAPLGLIGEALDGDKIESVNRQLNLSLANFTEVNEGLRQREDLSNLFSVLRVVERMVNKSTELTRRAEKNTDDLEEMTSLRDIFGQAARRPSLLYKFRKAARHLLTSKKHAAAMTSTVPWSRGT